MTNPPYTRFDYSSNLDGLVLGGRAYQLDLHFGTERGRA